jgi:drug/metabolite transporter (DMT)-like permease
MGMMGPIFTIILAVYLLDEPFTLMIALGGLMILAGVFSLVVKQPLSKSV